MKKRTSPPTTSTTTTSTTSTGHESSSGAKYKGVRKRKWGKYVSEIRLPNSRERIWLGSYNTAEKAARAFDAAQFCLRGRTANFNFPDNPPEIAEGRSMTPAEIQAAAARFANTAAANAAVDSAGNCRNSTVAAEEEEEEDEEMSCSPSASETMGHSQVESEEVAGVERSFYEQLSLSTAAIGSGNFASDFGLYEYDYFTDGNFYIPPQDDFQYVGGGGNGREDDSYDASLYQDSFLWNF